MLSKAIIALLAATAVSASPAAGILSRAELQPWQITSLVSHSPSGRPGNDPHSTLNITITDPNTIPVANTPTGTAVFPPSTANCSTQWLTASDVPYGVEKNCTPIDYGYWSFKIVRGSGEAGYTPVDDFGVEFKLVDSVRVLNKQYTRKFTGGDKFKVGNNLAGQCGGSGQCTWSLKSSPYPIKQTEQTS